MVVLWPHVRPWRTVEPEPMLRCVPDARLAADVLTTALRAAFPDAATAVTPTYTEAVPNGAAVPHEHAVA